ncbi:alpha/beta hydrolase [Vibrio eleionomae]
MIAYRIKKEVHMARVIFLHGVGANGETFSPLINMLHLDELGLDAFTPDGPYPFDGSAYGRQWFSISGVTEENRLQRVEMALPKLKEVLESYGPLEDTILVGFSQGSIMSLHAAAAGFPVKGVISIAGRLSGPVDKRDNWPPITFIHDNDDPVIDISKAQESYQWLQAAGATPEAFTSNEVGHSIGSQMIPVIRQQIEKML